jgi:hypothetical protein
MPKFMITLFMASALLLAVWFVWLHALWHAPPPVTAQEAPKRIETLAQQKLSEVTGSEVTGLAATEAISH